MNPELLDVIRIKVGAFRNQECKEVLQQLGLPRSGNKGELVGRILTIFQDAATLTAQGHTLRDQGRVDAAAAVVDSIFQRLVQEDVHAALCANLKLKRDHPGAAAADADADAAGPNKRPRLQNPLLPHQRAFKGTAAAAAGAGNSDVDEIITAFVSGDDCMGASNTRVRCVCSNHVRREPMLQCEGAFCGVWQHATCVKQQLLHSQLVPHPPGSEKWPKRRQFFCERCRVARADPFWEVYDTLVMPPQLGRPTESRLRVTSLVSQTMEWTLSVAGPATLVLNSHQRRLLHDSPQEYQLQVMALCLDDKVHFRLQWPTAPMLRFNGHQLRVVNRNNGTGLGVMQRDAPCNLSPLLGPPASTQGATFDVTLEYADPHHTVLLLAYIMRRRTREQVKALMKAPEPLPVAVQRVQQFMNPNGSTSSSTNPAASAAPRGRQQPPAAAAAGDDGILISDDDDIVLGNRVVSLKDPNTFLRIQHPARFTDTTGNDLQMFELESFLEVADKTFKWIDPHSMKASCVQNMQVDTYMAHIIASLAHQPDVLEVEINGAAEWRPAGSSGAFRSVLDPHSSTAAAAAAGGGGLADMSSDEEDEAAELRRAVSEMRRSRHPERDVIEILDSDDENQPQQQQQRQQRQQQPAAGGGGLRIALPSRAQQQQEHLQQQAAVATMAAAAVGPPVPHAAAHGGGVGLQASAGSGGGGVLSPRVVTTVATNRPMQPWQLLPLQQQQQQHQPPPQQQQIQQVQQQVGNGPGLQGFAPPRLGSGDVGLGFPMGPASGGGMAQLGGALNPQQQQQQQQGLQQGQVQGQLLHYTCPGGGQSGTVLCVGQQLYVPVVTGGGYMLGGGGLAAGGGGVLAGGQQSHAQMVLQSAAGLQQQGSGSYQIQQQGSGSYQVQQHQQQQVVQQHQQQQAGQQQQLQQQQGNMPYMQH